MFPRIASATAGALCFAMMSAVAPHYAVQAATSPFVGMAGSWSGGGTITMANGARERVRCLASYGVAGGGEGLRLNLRCASDSYNFDLAGDVAYRGGAISGSWREATHNVAGTISGRAVGDHIEAAATGGNFAANLSLTTRGNRQAVSIRPEGTDVSGVSITLTRR